MAPVRQQEKDDAVVVGVGLCPGVELSDDVQCTNVRSVEIRTLAMR